MGRAGPRRDARRAACGDDDAPTPPVTEQPEALALEAPESVTEGEDFPISVTVFGEDRNQPLADFSGTVQLGASAGSIEPASVQIVAGVGSATARITVSTGPVTVQATLSTLTASSVLDVIAAFVTLEGDPDDPVEGAIPERTFVSDPAEFRGTWGDVSTCQDPGEGTFPITIWLYEHDPFTDAIRVAVRYADGGSIGSAGDYFEGTIVNGNLLAYGEDDPDDYEIQATLSGSSLIGRVYEHCSDGTADMREFTTTRVN